MNELLPQFDKLYVVSDIHMGGRKDAGRNFQIFKQGKRLSALIRKFKNDRKQGESVCLVINGDLIDTLAEEDEMGEDYVAFTSKTALRIMKNLYSDPSFDDVWAALGGFVRTEGCRVVIVLGNHDLELSFPMVQRSIANQLADGDLAARSRIEFAVSGAGYSCSVGGAAVFCTHGNEVDPWNFVDYTKLGQLSNALNAGRDPDRELWEPNAGTKLVVEVMNKVKRQYPFVDLLKPETRTVFAVLLAIRPDLVLEVDWRRAPGIFWELFEAKLEKPDILGSTPSDEELATVDSERAVQMLLGPNLSEALGGAPDGDDDEALLLQAGVAATEGGPYAASLDAAREARTLGWPGSVGRAVQALLSRARKVGTRELLRRALKDLLKKDATFDVQNREDGLYQEMMGRVAPNFRFVVTGHTHLAQRLEIDPGRFYFNCGTWVRLLRLTKELLEAEEFKRVYGDLAAGSMDRLDKSEMLVDRTNYVQIVATDKGATGELMRVTGDDETSLGIESQDDLGPFEAVV